MGSSYVLGPHQYGKAEVRLVRLERETPEHGIADLTVTTQLRGDFDAAYTDGDNAHVHATDTQKNTVYALAKEHGVASPEAFLLVLAGHWRAQPWVAGTQMTVQQHAWDRVGAGTPGAGHSFARSGGEVRTAVVQTDGDETFVLGGLTGLTLLKSTGSEFSGFPRDRFTTLAGTTDRILATSVTAWWRYAGTPPDWDAAHATIRAALVEAFAATHSLALQQTIHAMGTAAMDAVPEVAEIRISCPNKHHFEVDLSPFGLANGGEVFVAADRPYGLIQATLQRAGVPAEPRAWTAVPAFA
ncbi:factor-independent urate hydroxylase [Blastococcus sp. VKM Ac-2987]|uniref:factor-independent urate hydroxylase n=1 Tax=Blastococcus sp. VKM Ac-2987 TaxID=3004141 RepID=UPI0022AB77EA|nr:urate oxidase [Blastococcus sp. VKM Ac-2987]MCZ2860772.1 urate oxidase [Blastococcus sp. VKM Ac-2987]